MADVITIREWNPLEPAVVEEKHFAPGVGMISENEVAGGGARIDLVNANASANASAGSGGSASQRASTWSRSLANRGSRCSGSVMQRRWSSS